MSKGPLLFIGLAAIISAVGLTAYEQHQGEAAADATARRLARALCGQDALKKVVDAYPQAHMTREQLGRQTLGQGLQRLAQLHDKLPGIVQPVFAYVQTDDVAWRNLSELGRQVSAEGRKRRWAPKVKTRFETFVRGTVTDMRAECPGTFEQPIYARYANFAVGAIVGAAGSQ